jgi:hypothetical protein
VYMYIVIMHLCTPVLYIERYVLYNSYYFIIIIPLSYACKAIISRFREGNYDGIESTEGKQPYYFKVCDVYIPWIHLYLRDVIYECWYFTALVYFLNYFTFCVFISILTSHISMVSINLFRLGSPQSS